MPAYKDKKGNSWYAKFNYKNWKGETKFTTKRGFPTKRAAVEYEREFKLHIAGDLDMNFEEFVKLYREDLYPRIRVSTAATKDHIINTKLIPYFKNFKVTEIKAKDIVKWQNELLSYRNPETGKPYMKTYLKTVHNQMNAIMNFAVKYYDLKDNPVEKAGSIGISNAEEMKFWVLDEYLQFSEAMMEEPFFYYCFEVLYWCGLREGELLALTYDDFDFVNKTISITKTYQIVNKEEVIGPTKTPKGTRVIRMPDKLCEEMKDYFEMCYDSDNSRAFPTSKSVLTRAMERGAKRAGVKRIRIHDLRHSHISLLINLGFSAVDIAKRVGHESITITLRYAHMFPSAQDKMMNNGSLGTVVSLDQSYVEVLFDNNWKVCFGKRNFTVDRRDIPGKTTDVWQIPIRPAYAITIHKSQGQTFQYVNIDGTRCWAPGQLYVAVSRARKIEGIHFLTPIKHCNIKTDPAVIRFYEQL